MNNQEKMTVDHLFESEVSFEISVRAVFVQLQDGEVKVLVGKHSEYEKLIFPGGRVEQTDLEYSQTDFNVAQVLCRELKEEIGLNIWDVYIKTEPLISNSAIGNRYLYHKWKNGNKNKVDLCFVFVLPPDYSLPLVGIPKGSEISKVMWISILPETTEELFPNTAEILKNVYRSICV